MAGGKGVWAEGFQRRTFTDGSEFFGGAEAFEEHGHFGPAARMYGEAQNAFAYGVHMEPTVRAKRASERCFQKAVARGEEPSLAFQPPKEEILADIRGFVAWYYNQHAKMLLEAAGKASRDENWAILEKLIKLSEGWRPFLEGRNAAVVQHLIANSTGFMLRARGQLAQAIRHFHEAHELARAGASQVPPWLAPQDLAIDLFYVGRALFEAGDSDAESFLRQAVEHLLAFESDTNLVLMGGDAALYLSQQYAKQGNDPEYAQRAMDAGIRALGVYTDLGRWDCVAQAFVQAARVCGAAPEDIRWELRASLAATLHRLEKEKAPGVVERLRRELRQAQTSDAGLEGIEQEVDSAPKRVLDAAVARTKRLVKADRLDDARNVLERIEALRVEGYTPGEYLQVRAQFIRHKARQLAMEARDRHASGNLGGALALLLEALALESLPEEMAAKLRQSEKTVRKQMDEAILQARAAIQGFIGKQDWEAARERLHEAEGIGIGEALEPEWGAIERNDSERKEAVQDLIEEAAQAMSKVKTVDRVLSAVAVVVWALIMLLNGFDKGFFLGLGVLLPFVIPLEIILYVWRRRILSRRREPILSLARSTHVAETDLKAFAAAKGVPGLFPE